jgi:hypothetical protein
VTKIFFHVGFHKTGTTSIQERFYSKKEVLSRHNIRYFHGSGEASHSAAWSLEGKSWGWKGQGARQTSPHVWRRLVSGLKSNHTDALVSSEFFSQMEVDKITRIKQDIGTLDVKIIFTWRPLQDLLASSYQQYLKYGISVTFDEWLHSIFDNPGQSSVTPTFWRRHLHGDVMQRWSKVFGAENISLIVVDPKDPESVFGHFEKLMSLPQNLLTTDKKKIRNVSLSAEEASLLRTINAKFPRNLGWKKYESSIRRGAIESLSPERDGALAARLELPQWIEKSLAEIQEIQHSKIHDSGVEILGDFSAAINTVPRWGSSVLPNQVPVSSAAAMLVGSLTPDLSVYTVKSLLYEVFARISKKMRRKRK